MLKKLIFASSLLFAVTSGKPATTLASTFLPIGFQAGADSFVYPAAGAFYQQQQQLQQTPAEVVYATGIGASQQQQQLATVTEYKATPLVPVVAPPAALGAYYGPYYYY